MARHHDVVPVSVNHRLNVLGFFDLAEIGGAGLCRFGERRHDGPGGGAPLGARQHRQFRRRSRQGHDLRPVGRRLQGDHPDGHAVGGGTDSIARRCSRAAAAILPAASIQGADQAVHEGTGPRAQGHRRAAEDGVGQAERGRQRRRRPRSIRHQGEPRAGLGAGTAPRVGSGPTVDGRIVTMRSFYDGAPEISKNVPMLMGSVSEEGNRDVFQADRGGVARHPGPHPGRGQGDRADRRHEEGAPGEEHPHAVLRRERPAVPQHHARAWPR